MKHLVLFILCLLTAQPNAAQVATGESADGLLLVTGQVERSRVDDSEPLTLWITFENRTDKPVRELSFVGPFRTPGFKKVPACWPSDVPACRQDVGKGEDPIGLPSELAAASAVTVRGDLTRQGRSGTFLFAGVYAWRDAAGHERRGVVWGGPVEVTKNWADWRARVAEDLPEVLTEVVLPILKDLALPIAAFLLGLIINRGAHRRAGVQQTWTQMLSKSHENAERYYMPVSSAIYGWRDSLAPQASNLQAARPQTGEHPQEARLPEKQVDEAFYYFALLLRRMQGLREKIGGFYFKDRLGESIAAQSWELLRDRFENRFSGSTGKERADLLAYAVEEHETFYAFRDRYGKAVGEGRSQSPALGKKLVAWIKEWSGFEPVPAQPCATGRELRTLREEFVIWISDPSFEKLELPLAELLERTIDFEMNRTYEPWYNRPERFDRQVFTRLEQSLRAWVNTAPERGEPKSREKERESARSIHALLRTYRRRNTGRSARGLWKPLLRLWWTIRLAEIWTYRGRRKEAV